MQYDLLVIGAGPAGVTAALRARELGATVALAERGRPGGTCTNDGCVPTRVLAKAARLQRDAAQFEQYGLSGPAPTMDFAALLSRAQQVVYTIQEKKQLLDHLDRSGVHVYHGLARFIDPYTVQVGPEQRIAARRVVLCAGGRARRLDFPGAELALTHSDVWSLKALPASIAVVGAAATGCQLASILAAFGSQVHLLEVAPSILRTEDPDLVQVIQSDFASRGIQMTTGIQAIERIEQRPSAGLRLVYRQDDASQRLDVQAVLLSAGWVGNLSELNLPAAGVETAGPYVQVDDRLRTSAGHIYAAGDITGRMMLVQSAGMEGQAAAENAILGAETSVAGHTIVPHGGFTDPEYGSVGLTEPQAAAQGAYIAATVSFAELDRAVIDGHTTGLCKLIVSPATRQVLGAHVVGEQALEIVHLVAANMAAGAAVDILARLEIAYPTYTAAVGLAARRILTGLGERPLTPQWRALGRLPAEWERQDTA